MYLHRGSLCTYIEVHYVPTSRFTMYLHRGSLCTYIKVHYVPTSRFTVYLHRGSLCTYIEVHCVPLSSLTMYLFLTDGFIVEWWQVELMYAQHSTIANWWATRRRFGQICQFCYKIGKIFANFLGYFEKRQVIGENYFGNFWGNLSKNDFATREAQTYPCNPIALLMGLRDRKD